MKKSILFITLLSFWGTACEKAVEFKIEEVTPKLVVEATIENNQPPVVYLSNSLGYFFFSNRSKYSGKQFYS